MAARQQQRTAGDDPNFVDTFFKSSRLHFIGTWRKRYEELLAHRPDPPPRPSTPPGGERVIAHVDFDCFFASVALLERPWLRGKPVAVCWGKGQATEVSSCNYPAREFGVKSGMPLGKAKELCPSLCPLPYEFEKYTDIGCTAYEAFWEVNEWFVYLSLLACFGPSS